MNVSKILISSTAALAVVGAIGLANAQSTPGTTGTTTTTTNPAPNQQMDATTPKAPEQSPTMNSSTMNRSTTASGDLAPQADRN